MKPDYNLFEKPQLIADRHFWIKAWNAANSKSHFSKRRHDADIFSFWGKMADQFEQNPFQERLRQRLKRTMDFLEKEKFRFKNSRIIDIGCGTGDFSLAFAKEGALVTALEPAESLLSRLTDKADKEKVAGIKPLQKEWDQAWIDGDIAAGTYDLAFASLNPGIRDPESLDKMSSSTAGSCLLCDIGAGGGRSPSRAELWEAIFAEKMPPTYYNIIYPYCYLYSCGYDPTLKTWTDLWSENQPLEDAVESAIDFFSLYTEPGKALEEVIEKYFRRRSVNGVYREEYPVRMGLLYWKA